MYPTADLLKDCQRLLKELEKDIRARADGDAALAEQYAAARTAGTTGITIGAWLSEQVTQAAVAWVLATVFVRFLEDNRLIDQTSGEITAWISGPDDDDQTKSRLKTATLAREAYITEHPDHSDVQYLLQVVREVGRLPACRDLFAEDRNPLFRLSVSADGAKRILAFWREQDQGGAVIRVLTTATLADTRWLGDLYQDLSADARKRFALLQTPDFVEEFILDYTLTPAIQTFGLEGLRGIDPTCGSGHFLLGMFHRLWHAWEQQLGPGVPVKEAVRRAMGSIYGIDLNPFAVAISRFRLMIAGLVACGYTRMKDCPDFGFTLAVGNTLTLGMAGGFQGNFLAEEGQDHPDYLTPGEYQNAKRVLSQQYHVVVGNPPYIAVKDAAERERIKPRYQSCFKKWTLSVPFTERFFNLTLDATDPTTKATRSAGFVGLINSNNFTKREFGKALIEQVLPSLDLTHVIDTSGCYIPGHGTPTVILFGRNQMPSAKRPVRAVQGIRGEPGRPDDAAHGKVWTAMAENLGRPGTETLWLSVADVERRVFAKHPWSLGGGGAGPLRELVEAPSQKPLSSMIKGAGIMALTAEDDAFLAPPSKRFSTLRSIRFGIGEDVRDWEIHPSQISVFPYSTEMAITPLATDEHRFFWPSSRVLKDRYFFGKYPHEAGIEWFEYFHLDPKRAGGWCITFGEVATHNHFVLSRGGVVFKQTAPVIKLPAEATEDDHLALLACLNSSTAAFWFRQVCTCKGGPGGGKTYEDAYLNYFAFNSTNIERTPITDALRPERIALTKRIDALGQELAALQPSRQFSTQAPTRQLLDQTAARVVSIRAEMVFLQEELDWLIYRAYGILTEDECPLAPGSAGVPARPGAVGVPPTGDAPSPWKSRGYLPHFDAAHATQAITFRLADSLPKEVLTRLKAEIPTNLRPNSESAKQQEAVYRKKIEAHMDAGAGCCLLRDPEIAALMQRSLQHFDGQRYRLIAWTIMPNHVHVLIQPLAGTALEVIVQGWKSYTAHEMVKIMRARSQACPSPVWQADYFDRFIRDEPHFLACVAYIRENPVKAGLVASAGDWVWGSAWGSAWNRGEDAPNPRAGETPALPGLDLGERAFEIDLARKVAAEEEETSWFERHRSTPITEIPAHWPAAYQQVIQRRLDLIASHPHIGLLEKPEHKRRWQSEPWNDVVQRGLRDWLCDQLEDRRLWPAEPALISTTTLADRAFRDATFAQVATLYRGNDHFDQHELIRELVSEESVPALPIQRYTEEGLIKRADWEKTWDLQRHEDAGETVDIPVPPRYTAKDFLKASFWSHRGKLDVPKERFISYPGAAPDGDAGLLVLWAGYNHLEHTQALIAHYQWAKDQPTWTPTQAIPLLASLDQLIPWLTQWHNDLDPTHGVRLGDSYAEFLATECHELSVTVKDLRAWKPTAVSRAASPSRVATSEGGDAPKKRGRPKKAQV